RDHDDHQLAGLNFHPNGPYPILDLYGVDGSAKGSTARRIKRFTDPDYLKDRPLPRMADFGVWMARATPALGWHPNKFTDAYTANRALAAFDVVERDTMGPAVLEFVDSQQVTERPDGRLTQRWEGTLLNALPVTPETRKQKGFPHPNTLPDHLRRTRNSL